MGSLTNMIRQATNADEEEQRQKERMQLLLVAAKSKIESFRNQLDEGFTNPALIEKTQIPGIRAIRYIEQYHVASKNSFSDQVSGHLDAAIDSFFSIGEGKDKQAVQNGIKALIQTGLSAFIGSTEAGESMDKMYFVVPENNAFIRADVMCWKYHLTQDKLLAQNDTAVAYVLCKSVIDHTAIKLDELIYLVTQALSTGVFAVDTSKSNIDNISPPDNGDIWKKVLVDYKLCSDAEASVVVSKLLVENNTKICIRESEADPSKKKPPQTKIDLQYLLSWEDVKRIVKCRGWFSLINQNTNQGTDEGTDNYSLYPHYGIDTLTEAMPMSPAKLSDVEAYIDEMVRVWKKLEADR